MNFKLLLSVWYPQRGKIVLIFFFNFLKLLEVEFFEKTNLCDNAIKVGGIGTEQDLEVLALKFSLDLYDRGSFQIQLGQGVVKGTKINDIK